MRVPLALACLALAAPVRADEPNARAYLEAVEKQLKAVHEKAGASVACVVVSRSELYPKPAKPPAHPGQFGDYSPSAFLKENPGKASLAAHLDLADVRNAAAHSYTGGVVVDAAGLVLTTFQPLDGATRLYVHLPGGKGSYADIHAADARCDLAVLKLLNPPAGLKEITLGTASLGGPTPTVYPGKMVVLMSNPFTTGFRFDRPSGGIGVISNVRRRLTSPLVKKDDRTPDGTNRSAYAYGAFLEHDAKLHAECSGQPLLNLDGDLIGLTTQGHTLTGAETGPGFAFPMDANTRRIVEALKRGEEVEYGYFGISTSGGEAALTLGTVTPLGPAWTAGLQPGDRITRIDGVTVSGYSDLLYFGGSALAGTRVKVNAVGPLGDAKNVEVVLGKYKHDEPYIASVRPDPVFGLTVDHGSILAQRLFNRDRFAPTQTSVPPGVCVRTLAPDSPAAAKFKTIGDNAQVWLITHVNGTPTDTPTGFLKAAKGKDSLRLTILDPLRPQSRELTIP